jgi:hypothetical protein
MTSEVTERLSEDGYEFLERGEIIGRLVWVAASSQAPAGWWLVVDGELDTLLFRVVDEGRDIEAMRREGEAGSRFLAKAMLSDRVSGLLSRTNTG